MDNQNNPQQQNQGQIPTQTDANISQNLVNQVPVSTASQKEQEKAPLSAYVQPSENEPNLHPEVAEAGVETVSEMPVLTEEHEKIGLKLAKESLAIPKNPQGVALPMSEKEAKKIVKLHKKVGDSIYWLAKLILKQFKTQRKIA